MTAFDESGLRQYGNHPAKRAQAPEFIISETVLIGQ